MYVPGVILGAFISLSLFYYYNQKSRIRREDRRDRFEEKHEALMEMLRSRKEQEEGPFNKDQQDTLSHND